MPWGPPSGKRTRSVRFEPAQGRDDLRPEEPDRAQESLLAHRAEIELAEHRVEESLFGRLPDPPRHRVGRADEDDVALEQVLDAGHVPRDLGRAQLAALDVVLRELPLVDAAHIAEAEDLAEGVHDLRGSGGDRLRVGLVHVDERPVPDVRTVRMARLA